uniref:Uncharacterized protein n=1 Tax=Anopheles atroparvus TaxID=41427 RepID=A0AAG5CWI0_ANOAO
MADEQPGSCDKAFGEYQADHDILKNEYVQKIQQLMYQDKTAAIAEVVNLTFITLKQEEQIALLDQYLKQVSMKNEMVQKTLLSEQQCLGAVQAVEKQRNSMAAKLSSERDQTNAQLKSCEKIRSQMKNEVVASREAMEKLIRGLNEMKEIVNKQAMENESLKTRYDTCKSELTEKIEKQKRLNDAQRASYDEATAKFESMIKERDAEVMELSEKLNGMNEKLCKLRSERDQAAKMFEQCKLDCEQASFNMKQKRDTFKKELKERHDEQVLAWNKEISELEERKKLLENEKRSLEEQEQVLIEANQRYKEEEEQFELKNMQHVSKGETLPAGGTRKITPDKSFDLDEIESYHYDNEMSLQLDSSSNYFLGRHFKQPKK